MDDEKIVALFYERDEQALLQTQQKYNTYCLAIAERIVGSHEDAEECVNDAYCRAWETIPPEKPQILSSYIGLLTRRISLNKARANRAAKRGGGELVLALDEMHDVVAADADLATEIADREFSEIFNRFLWSLPKRDCNIFIRRYYYIDPIPLIAKRYGLSVYNVQKILSRTRQKLREYLEKEGYAV